MFTTGTVPRLEQVLVGRVRYAVKRAVWAPGVSGDIIAAVAGKSLIVLAAVVQCYGAGSNFKITDGNGGADLTPQWDFDTGRNLQVLSLNPLGWLKNTAGNSLYGVIAGTVRALFLYVEV